MSKGSVQLVFFAACVAVGYLTWNAAPKWEVVTAITLNSWHNFKLLGIWLAVIALFASAAVVVLMWIVRRCCD